MLKYADYLTGKGIGMSEIGEVMFYSAFFLFPQVVPLAILVSSLIAFGTLGEHNELTAIKSAGVSLLKIIFPVFLFVSLLSGFLYFYNDNVLPKANIKVWSLLYDISKKSAPFSLQEGAFSSGLDNYSIKVDQKFDEGKSLKGVMIYQKSGSNGRNDHLVLADSGRISTLGEGRYLIFELFDGAEYREDPDIMKWSEYKNKPFLALGYSKFKKSKMVIDMSELALHRTPEEQFSEHKRMKSFGQIWQLVDSFQVELKVRRSKLFENLKPYYTYHFKTPNKEINIDSFDYGRIKLQNPLVLQGATQYGRSLVAATQSFQDTLRHFTWTASSFAIEAWSRYNKSIACILMFVIGASIGAIVKKGGLGVPAMIALMIFVFYYVLSMQGEKLSKELILDVNVGMMLCNAVLLPVGVFCLIKAKNDSTISFRLLKLFRKSSKQYRKLSKFVGGGKLDMSTIKSDIVAFKSRADNLKSLSGKRFSTELESLSSYSDKLIEHLSEQIEDDFFRARLKNLPRIDYLNRNQLSWWVKLFGLNFFRKIVFKSRVQKEVSQLANGLINLELMLSISSIK